MKQAETIEKLKLALLRKTDRKSILKIKSKSHSFKLSLFHLCLIRSGILKFTPLLQIHTIQSERKTKIVEQIFYVNTHFNHSKLNEMKRMDSSEK